MVDIILNLKQARGIQKQAKNMKNKTETSLTLAGYKIKSLCKAAVVIFS